MSWSARSSWLRNLKKNCIVIWLGCSSTKLNSRSSVSSTPPSQLNFDSISCWLSMCQCHRVDEPLLRTNSWVKSSQLSVQKTVLVSGQRIRNFVNFLYFKAPGWVNARIGLTGLSAITKTKTRQLDVVIHKLRKKLGKYVDPMVRLRTATLKSASFGALMLLQGRMYSTCCQRDKYSITNWSTISI